MPHGRGRQVAQNFDPGSSRDPTLVTHEQRPESAAEASHDLNHQVSAFRPTAPYANAAAADSGHADSAQVPPPPPLELFVPAPPTSQDAPVPPCQSRTTTLGSSFSALPPFLLDAMPTTSLFKTGRPGHENSYHKVCSSVASVTYSSAGKAEI
jgi:hypothetical protein